MSSTPPAHGAWLLNCWRVELTYLDYSNSQAIGHTVQPVGILYEGLLEDGVQLLREINRKRQDDVEARNRGLYQKYQLLSVSLLPYMPDYHQALHGIVEFALTPAYIQSLIAEGEDAPG